MNFAYWYFAFSAIINAVVSILLGIFILSRNTKSNVNRTFALFCFGVAAWSIPYIWWPFSNTAEDTLLSFQLLHIGACFVSIFYLHFVVCWLGIYKQKKKLILFGYLLSAFFAVQTFSPLFIKDMVPKFSMRYWADPGILYHFYLLMFFGFAVYASVLLFKNYRKSQGLKKKQTLLLLLGLVLAFIGGSTNYFLWYDINIPPWGNIFVVVYVILTAYSIVKFKLFDIRVILTEAAVVIVIIALLVQTILSESVNRGIINGFVLLAVVCGSYLLIKSVQKEIKQRKQLQDLLNHIKKVDVKLRKANANLRCLDEAKSNFVSIASHQLRTPITGIKGYLSMFMEGDYGELSDKQKKVIQMNLDAVERMVKLIDVFLDISRIEADRVQLTKEMVQLGDIIDSVVKELRPMAEKKGLKLYEEIKGKLPETYVDPQKIRQVVLNLIDNATKYTVEGSVKIIAWAKGNKIIVEVKDTGIGIAKEEVHRLFSKFVRAGGGAKIDQSGSGLGLFIIKGLVEAHGGKVYVKSEGEGKGTTFGFILNVEQEPKKKN